MSHNPGTGYKGFRSWAVQASPTLNPGETIDSRSQKFSTMGYSTINPKTNYPKSLSNKVGNAMYQSVTSSDYSSKKYLYNSQSNGQSKKVEEEENTRKENLWSKKKFIGRSTYQSSFANNSKDILEHFSCPVEMYKASFDQLQQKNAGDLYLENLFQVFWNCNPTISEYEIGKVIQFLEKQKIQTVYWDDFVQAYEAAKDLLQREMANATSSKVPLWFNDKIPSKVLKNEHHQSSYQTDYGKYGHNPKHRPYVYKNGMASTTNDMNQGTTKGMFHIPGYTGFITKVSNNAVVAQHSNGQNPRPKQGDLRLYHQDTLPGYTGHRPKDAKNIPCTINR